MQQLLFVIHVMTCVALIIVVLVQHGKGADMGVAFGSGSSNSLFGSGGTTSLMVKLTTALAMLFFTTSLLLGQYEGGGVDRSLLKSTIPTTPVQKGK
ncbi:MAG TPA: preprotein translocase subunit SecG [Gammaproteobacteria bacterium]|nr:preprotein translocase subunit SecG [Gammaproteobacteria bacterium]